MFKLDWSASIKFTWSLILSLFFLILSLCTICKMQQNRREIEQPYPLLNDESDNEPDENREPPRRSEYRERVPQLQDLVDQIKGYVLRQIRDQLAI